MKYFIKTFGCQMNEHDSEMIAGLLEQAGYTPACDTEHAEIIVVNTCCVRESAEHRIKGYLGNLKILKEQGQVKVIAVCGCMTQQQQMVDYLQKSVRHVQVILGTYAQHRLPEYIAEVLAGKKRVVDTATGSDSLPDELPTKRGDKVRAGVNIIYGCNNFCTYCIVPYVRNEERSRAATAVLAEVRGLAAAGYKEIQLLGQNVNSYHDGELDFAALLQQVGAVEGIQRVRYMTSHPRDFDAGVVAAIQKTPNICHQFHLPLQSGCNRILEQMNRGYTREEYLAKLQMIRAAFPDAVITTDLIVGFPGETDEDFAETLAFLEECQFDAAYTFLYSKRSGTPAALLPEQVNETVKKERLQRLMQVQNPLSLAINQAMIGQKYEVLVEGASRTNADTYTGRSDGNKIVVFPANRDLTGQIVPIEILSAKTWNLEGRVADD